MIVEKFAPICKKHKKEFSRVKTDSGRNTFVYVCRECEGEKGNK